MSSRSSYLRVKEVSSLWRLRSLLSVMVRLDAKARLPDGRAEEVVNLRSLGLQLQLDKYSGQVGECALWWSKFKRSLMAMSVPTSA